LKIRVEIDQLILYGFNNKEHDSDHIDKDIENELGRLIGNDRIRNKKVIKREGINIDRVNGGLFNFDSGRNISKLAGASIARSIYSVIGSNQ
jgi:hypothetical protein